MLTTNLASINGGYMCVSGLVTYLLAHGMDPVRVAGYASLAFMPVILKFVDLITVDQFFGINTGICGIIITTAVAAIAVGTLH
jgi:hypothetical protein